MVGIVPLGIVGVVPRGETGMLPLGESGVLPLGESGVMPLGVVGIGERRGVDGVVPLVGVVGCSIMDGSVTPLEVVGCISGGGGVLEVVDGFDGILDRGCNGGVGGVDLDSGCVGGVLLVEGENDRVGSFPISSMLRGALFDRECGVEGACEVEGACGVEGTCGLEEDCGVMDVGIFVVSIVMSSSPLPSSSCMGEDMSMLINVM